MPIENEPGMVLSVIFGTLLTFGGWGFYRAGIRFTGFLMGAAIGVILSYTILVILLSDSSSFIPWGVVICAGILGYFGSKWIEKLYYWIVFLVGAVYGAGLKVHLIDEWESVSLWIQKWSFLNQPLLSELIFALIAGILFVSLHRYLIVGLTSIFGSGLISIATNTYWLFPCLLLLGIITQLRLINLFLPKVLQKGKKQNE